MIRVGRVPLVRLAKAIIMVSVAPISIIMTYALSGRLEVEHALYALLGIVTASGIFVHPYIANVQALTEYVKKLVEDKRVEKPDLSFLNTVEELSRAVEALHNSWQIKKLQLEAILAENKIVVEVLPDALLMLDDNLAIVRTNSAARNLLGHRLIERNLREVIEAPELISVLEDMRTTKKRTEDLEFITGDAMHREIRAQIKKFPAESLSGTEFMVTLHDLTELKRVRKIRSDFVANASHELKTPLSSIIGFIETLRGSAKNDEAARDYFLGVMADQAKRMARLIDDLLSLSKIEANVIPPSEEVNISEVLEEAKKHNSWSIKENNVEVAIEYRGKIPIIIGDSLELTRVFDNLIENAVKYGGHDSRVSISIEVSKAVPPEIADKYESVLLIRVRDYGQGIAPEHLSRLTERFYRVDAARSNKMGGTGLGLAIVKHIITRHNGVLRISSELGKGTEFAIFLPIEGV